LPIDFNEIGNPKIDNVLPATLHDAGNLSLQRQFAKTNAAQVKLAQVTTRPATAAAARVPARRKLRLAISFRD
jgi:hypothetical protein